MRRRTSDPAPSLSPAEIVAAGGGGALVAAAVFHPLLADLGRVVPQDLGDPLLQTWQLAWGGHALVSQPTRFFQANAFWPLPDSLAFSDALVGYAPLAVPGAGVVAALVRYGLIFLFAHALAYAGAYLLARDLGAGRWGGVVAGLAFAYAPFRLTHLGHLHVLSSGGIPLALFLLARGYRRRDPRLVVGGWLVAAWQLSLGFTLGLPLAYLLLALGVVGVGSWLGAGRPPPPPRLVLATAAGAGVFAAVGALLARPYLRVVAAHPEARRSLAEVAYYSPPPRSLLAPPGQSVVWGGFDGIRSTLPVPVEQSLFPGLAVLTLAGLALLSPAVPRRTRLGLAVAAAVTAVFALGLTVFDGRFTYRLLYDHAPGWQGIRTPGRLFTVTALALALLAGLGATRVLTAARQRGAGVYHTVGLTLAALVLVEGVGRVPFPPAPRPPAADTAAPAPVLHLPTELLIDVRYLLWSTDSFPAMANGYAGFTPQLTAELRAATTTFPDERSVALLRRLGVRTVVVHRALAAGTAWRYAADPPAAPPPGVVRVDRGNVVTYALGPAASG